MTKVELTDKAQKDVQSIKDKLKDELSEAQIVEIAVNNLNKEVTVEQYSKYFTSDDTASGFSGTGSGGE